MSYFHLKKRDSVSWPFNEVLQRNDPIKGNLTIE